MGFMRRGLTAFALVAALAACGGGEVPDGYAEITGDGFVVAVPGEWEVEQSAGVARGLSEPLGEGLRRQARVELDEQFGGELDVLLDGLTAMAGAQHDDFEVVDELADVDVAGARQAYRLDATWTGYNDDDEPVDTRGLHLFAVGDDGDLRYLTVNSAAADYDDGWVEPIVDSFEVR